MIYYGRWNFFKWKIKYM